ncbi:hypothetical protein IT575_10260 [bacterium]|nr:hypothetical protein [bacterium]
MAAVREYDYVEEEPRRPLKRRARQEGIPGSFWLGAGIGLIFATAAVVTAVQVSHRTRRPRVEGEEDDLVVNLTEAVQEGLDVLSQAAQHLGYSFENARRELIRFGLDPLVSGISGFGNYYSAGDPTSPLTEEEDGTPEEWQGAGYDWADEPDAQSPAGSNGRAGDEETHGED